MSELKECKKLMPLDPWCSTAWVTVVPGTPHTLGGWARWRAPRNILIFIWTERLFSASTSFPFICNLASLSLIDPAASLSCWVSLILCSLACLSSGCQRFFYCVVSLTSHCSSDSFSLSCLLCKQACLCSSVCVRVYSLSCSFSGQSLWYGFLDSTKSSV